MSKDVNWADVDKRIRDRRVAWSNEEREALARDLESLPDRGANSFDKVTIPQPALVTPEAEVAVAAEDEAPVAAVAAATAVVAPLPVDVPTTS